MGCVRLPVEAPTWRAHNARLLNASLVAMDLTESEADAILDHFNAEWKPGAPFRHYHMHGYCKSGCQDAAEGEDIAVQRMRLASIVGK